MDQEIKNKVVVLEPCTPVVESLLKAIVERKQAEVLRVTAADEAIQTLRQMQPCMFVMCLHSPNELPVRVTMLKELESSIKYGLLKTLFVSKIKNPQVAALISSLGVTDFMEEPVPLRTLQFKTNLQLKAVETIRKQQEMKKQAQEKIVFKKAGQKEGAEGADAQANATPALELAEDTFLFKNSGLKKHGKKTVVELEGPDPASGEWVEHEDKGNAQAAWRWVPEEEKQKAAPSGDGWVHSGDKPQFQEASKKWQMASEKPELAYEKDGKKIAKKISTNAGGQVNVAADSPTAEANIKKAKIAGDLVKKKKEEIKLAAAAAKEAERNKEAASLASAKDAAAEKRELAQLNAKEKSAPRERETAPADGNEAPAAEKTRNAPGEETPGAVASLQEQREKKSAKEKPGAEKLSPLEFLQKKKNKAAALADAPAADVEGEEPAENSDPAALEKAQKPKASLAAEMEGLAEKKKLEKISPFLEKEKAPPRKSSPELEEESDEAVAKEELELSEPSAKVDPLKKLRPTGDETEAPTGSDLPGNEKKKDRPPVTPEIAALLEAKKKKVKREIQELIAQPIPKTLPPAEEARLREKFKLEDAPEVTPEALVRKEVATKIRAMKADLQDLEEGNPPQSEEGSPELRTHDLNAEEENTWSAGSQGGGGGGVKRRASDANLEEEEEEEDQTLGKKTPKNARDKSPTEDQYYYLKESEVTPLGGAWENAGDYLAFLDGKIRYKGFDKLEELLPLWIFQGERTPELLDKAKQWRFLGARPFAAKVTKEIPREVRDFLLALRDGIRKAEAEANPEVNRSARPESDETGSAAADGGDSGRRRDSTEEDASDSKAPKTQADTLEETFAKKKSSGTAGVSEPVAEKLKGESAGIEKFLERRKNKEKAATSAAPAAAGPAATPSSLTRVDPANPYLGVYVSLSNAFGPSKDKLKPIGKVLRSMEAAFGQCACALLSARSEDGLSQVQIGSGQEIPEGMRISPDAALPIQRGDTNETVGYLLLKKLGERKTFTGPEEAAIQKVASSIWSILLREGEEKAA